MKGAAEVMEATLICVLLQWVYNDTFPTYNDKNKLPLSISFLLDILSHSYNTEAHRGEDLGSKA